MGIVSINGIERELDSEKPVRKLLNHLDSEEMQSRLAVLENQAHILNYKKHNIVNESGIRRIILRRNKLGDKFAVSL
jgi:hypothetical protein